MMKTDVVRNFTLPKLTVLSVLLQGHEWGEAVESAFKKRNYRFTEGRVGSMELKKVIAAIETAAKSKDVINGDSYREIHALYHAIVEAVQGIGRGTTQIGDLLRTVGLTFSIVRGEVEDGGEWICVCLFGTIGGLKKGFEHEVIGFGYNHI